MKPLRELLSGLMTWVAISIASGLALTLWSASITNPFWQPLLAAVGSTAISISGALLITEVILKPLYVRDVLDVARLSSEVYGSGLSSITRANKLSWEKYLSGTGDINIAVSNQALLNAGAWQQIVEDVPRKKRQINIFVPNTDGGKEIATHLESSWGRNECNTGGSILKIVPLDSVTQGIIVVCDSFTVASIAEDPSYDNPLVVAFRQSNGNADDSTLRRGIERMTGSDISPLFEG
ncbi:hypothetical protein J2W20_002945 [Sinomonas atrocyanea]|uniref:hypothetical protein n=1 Tax=Sinomonas atrocyanea TaxID=37927 RepID=UPI00277F31F5|nr:hypothetical protein [Sinomonas atrocyanea]MDQ0261031.1 hypothetical protein [Sinomonas atrocyanea]